MEGRRWAGALYALWLGDWRGKYSYLAVDAIPAV
jgi:hypothetical protein